MVIVVNSDNFEIELASYSESDKPYKCRLKGFPTFYSEKLEYIKPVNLWFNFLLNVKKAKDISSHLRAIKRYWNFLEFNGLNWDNFPKQKSLKPTYRYRNDDLLKSVHSGSLKASTASLYMRHVVNFYEWAIHERLLKVSEHSKPFDYQSVKLTNNQMMRHIKPHFIVKSTDLRIKPPDRSNTTSLSPLNDDEIKNYLGALNAFSIEFKLHQLLQLNCGLRVNEACTFPLNVLLPPPFNKKRYEITIGPVNRVNTKFGATRSIEISASLMSELYKYSISERRQERAERSPKEDKNFHLLLNRKGETFSTNSIQEHFLRIKKWMKTNLNIVFRHKTHDLRSTYGTYRLASLLDSDIPESDAIALIMGWMGHKNEATTWKYIRFLRKETVRQNALSMLDKFLEEALKNDSRP